MELTPFGSRLLTEGYNEKVRNLEEEKKRLEQQNKDLSDEVRALHERVNILKRTSAFQDRTTSLMMMTLATAAGHPAPASFSVPTGSGWVRPLLSLDMVLNPVRLNWYPLYDQKLLSPIVTGCGWIPPHMKPGENLVDVIIPITNIAKKVFV